MLDLEADMVSRSIYWLHAAATGFSAILFFVCYHPPGFEQLSQTKRKREQVKNIDYIGFALYASGLISLLLALSMSHLCLDTT